MLKCHSLMRFSSLHWNSPVVMKNAFNGRSNRMVVKKREESGRRESVLKEHLASLVALSPADNAL